jgi:hypothetical protein
MARSVEELRRESERSRAELATTGDRLKESISETTEDLRQKASPQHIKAEISDFVSDQTQNWVASLKDRAIENPLPTVAAGLAVAAPLIRLMRGVPLPLLMIGAGLALTSKSVRDRVEHTVAPLSATAGTVMESAAARVHDLQDKANQTISSARSSAGKVSDGMQEAAGNLKDRTVQAVGAISDKISGGAEAVKDTFTDAGSAAKRTAEEAAAQAPEKARQIISENAAFVGGLGIAIGAIIAAALPSSRVESKIIGEASDRVKQTAGDAVETGLESAKEAALSVADSAAKSVAGADLGKHASRMTQGLAERLKEAADDVVTAAFNPSQDQKS